MTATTGFRFVARHGLVLEAAHGPVPSFVEAAVGERIRGHWWAHRDGRRIFRLTRALRDSPDVLVCRLVDDKITYVHRRLWPALARLARRLPAGRLAALREIHTRQGKHVMRRTPFARFLPAAVRRAGQKLSLEDALSQFETRLLPHLGLRPPLSSPHQ